MRILVIDEGLYVTQAEALSDNGKNEVVYCTNWQAVSPEYKNYAPGVNYKKLKKELYFFDWIEKADCVVNFDVPDNDLIAFLKRTFPKKSIYGSGHGEKLENDRWKLKEWIKTLGLPLQKSVKITGITALRTHLKTNKDKYIKINIFRGDRESFYSKDAEMVDLILDKLALVYGPHKEEIVFIVEDLIDTDVEIGCDLFFNGPDYLTPMIIGYEYHKNMYLGKVVDKLPKPLQETIDAFKPLLAKIDYRGAISTEEKIKSEKEHYFIDLCARIPNPLGTGYPIWIKNWPELVYKIGKGEAVKPNIPYKYLGAIALKTKEALTDYVRIDIKKGKEGQIVPIMCCMHDNKLYACKGNDEVVVLVAGGQSVDDVLKQLKDLGQYVEAEGLDKDTLNGIDKIKDIIAAGKKVGIDF